ncbi:MAG: flagellar filament capping protein FliD, partial [Bdellovibrionota bacterium]
SKVEYPTLYFLDGDQDLYFDDEREARNGRIKMDGFEFEIGDNTVKDLIPGVVLDLKQANPGRSVNISVKENREVVNTKINEFVKTMNDALSFLQAQSKLDENTDTSKTLGGDSLVRGVESRLRRLIQDPQYGMGTGSINRLGQLGIEITRSGTLKLNEDKFNQTLAAQPDDVRRFFTGDGFNVGFIPSLRREISTLTNSAFGQVTMRKRSLEENIKRIDQSIANKERQMTRREEQLRNKFAKLEETMSGLKQQGAAVGAIGGGYAGPNLGGAKMS